VSGSGCPSTIQRPRPLVSTSAPPLSTFVQQISGFLSIHKPSHMAERKKFALCIYMLQTIL
jgi:hypothetical protein